MPRTITAIVTDLHSFGTVSEDNVDAFEMLIQEASENHDRETLGPLLGQFDDFCEFDEVMFGLVHAVEGFPWDDYFTVLAERLSQILSKSPRWGSILVTRIMNSEKAYADFLARLSAQNEATKNEAIALMRQLSGKERFRRQCEMGIRILSRV